MIMIGSSQDELLTSGEDNQLATTMDPLSKDELLRHHFGGRHDDVEASGDDFPSGRVPGERQNSPDLRLTMTAVTELFMEYEPSY